MYNRSHSNKIYRAGLVEIARREYRHTSSSLLIRYQVPVGMSVCLPRSMDQSWVSLRYSYILPLPPCVLATTALAQSG